MNEAQYERTVGRLENWGIWSRSGGRGGIDTCGSAEKFYRESPRMSSPLSASDTRDAMLVDEAIARMANKTERKLIRATFMWKWRDDAIVSRYKFERAMVAPMQRRAVQGVFTLLQAIDLREAKMRARRLKLAAFANGQKFGV